VHLVNKIVSFLDGNAGYNQIFMAEEDVSKTAFRCPGFMGLFEWVVMTFGLKIANARNTTNKIARRVKNSRARFVKKHIQISINKLRDRRQIIPQFFHKSDIIQGEVVIYLGDAGTKHFKGNEFNLS
jgi:hypothetical protein